MLVVHQLARILLDMDALDADRSWSLRLRSFSSRQIVDLALAHQRMIELADLIALRQIGVEIILPVEARPVVDLRLDRHARCAPPGGCIRSFGTGSMPGIAASTRLTCVLGSAPNSVAAPEKSLALRRDLGVHFQADHDLPFAGCALDAIVAHSPPLASAVGAVKPRPAPRSRRPAFSTLPARRAAGR